MERSTVESQYNKDDENSKYVCYIGNFVKTFISLFIWKLAEVTYEFSFSFASLFYRKLYIILEYIISRSIPWIAHSFHIVPTGGINSEGHRVSSRVLGQFSEMYERLTKCRLTSRDGPVKECLSFLMVHCLTDFRPDHPRSIIKNRVYLCNPHCEFFADNAIAVFHVSTQWF